MNWRVWVNKSNGEIGVVAPIFVQSQPEYEGDLVWEMDTGVQTLQQIGWLCEQDNGPVGFLWNGAEKSFEDLGELG